jgi:hypothetical protein
MHHHVQKELKAFGKMEMLMMTLRRRRHNDDCA